METELRLRPILVFTSQYQSDKSLNRSGVDNTKELMEIAFFSKDGLNIPKEDGLIVFNDTYVSACDKIQDFILSANCENDILMFYFCGHGFADYINENVYLAMSDTNKSNWQNCGYNARNLVKLIKSAKIKHYIIVLDCCHSGFLCDMGDNEENRPINICQNENSEGAIYIASAMAEDVCYQTYIDDKYYVPFSYHFANALKGIYSSNLYKISLSKVYEQVCKKLNESNYNTKSIIQNKGDFVNIPIFEINKCANSAPKSFFFSDYFHVEKLNVLLVKTAIDHPIKNDDFGVPLGLWMLKGYLSTTGISLNVEIYDERLELVKCEHDENKRKKVLNQFPEIIKDYDVIGISMCSSEVPPALEKFKIAKEQNKITFCGGIFATSNEEYLVNTGLIDYVIAGVGTVPLGNLLARLAQEKQCETLGKHIINEYGVATKEYFYLYDMPWTPSQLPTMRQSMWIEILEQYGPYLGNRMDVYTARGCDKNCSFCSVQKESRQVIYRKEDACVIEEIKYLQNKGITYFSFKDENFFSEPDRMLRILREVSGPNIKFKIRARYDAIVASKISLSQLRDLGVDEIQYGIESPELYIRKVVRKGYKFSTNKELVNFILEHAEYGITANCSFILGISNEDTDYYTNLLEFIKEIYIGQSKPKIYINFLTPHPFNSQFPLDNYTLITKDLNFFTHKYPVCFAQDSNFVIRKKMLETYDEIVNYSNSQTYNPLTSNMPKKLKDAFLHGKKIQNVELF